MVEQAEAKKILYNLSSKIASGFKLTTKKDYHLPSEIKINPLTLEPYIVDTLHDDIYCMPICIGREISDDDVMPSICIHILENIPKQNAPNFLMTISDQNRNVKQIHPQLKMGILLYSSDPIPTEIVRPDYSTVTNAVDFIEVLGHIWDHEDKMVSVLENIIQEQIKSSESIARIMFGKDEFRSFRGNSIN